MGRASSSQQAAVALRVSGATYAEIAEVLGFAGPEEARTAVLEGLASEQVDADDREALRAQESRRLMRLLSGVWEKAVDPDSHEHLPAAKMALQLVDRHARLLGLDQPQEVIVHNPTAAEIDVWVAQVLEGNSPYREIEEHDPTELEAAG